VPYLGGVSRRLHWTILGLSLALGVSVGALIAIANSAGTTSTPQLAVTPVNANPRLDPGSPLDSVAPPFTLTDQFGKRVSLSAFRGKVVVLSFNDPECTTICPLTTTALLHAKELLGPAASRVQLLGIGANPEATQVKWVHDYSQVHRMLHKWDFLTGSLKELKRAWRNYNIDAAVLNGAIDHTPATFVIDPRGRLSDLYLAQMSYSSVNQLGYEIAQSISAVLPGHPPLRSAQSLATIGLLGPHAKVTLPRSGGGVVRFGPGTGPHLLVFFDTWDSEVTNLRGALEGLNRYAAEQGHPSLVAVDEATVEPAPDALPSFLAALPNPLRYPVTIDRSGRFADGYRVQDSPWLELVSGTGRILFSRDVAVKGWPTLNQLQARILAAQTK
jgi:cytochrome oxidase Cu insertion factor (SCO1/SenC/PrrC family)